MKSHFFAVISRMKYIMRWSLMKNTRQENLSEHSLDVAIIAHALAIIKNAKFDGNIDPNKAATLAIYHDVAEILTGDLPTPIKYFNPEINKAYSGIEKLSKDRLLSLLPDFLRPHYDSLFYYKDDYGDYFNIVKAADKLSALVKCIEEERVSNREFSKALISTRKILDDMNMPEVEVFINHFIDSYYLSLDELDYN